MQAAIDGSNNVSWGVVGVLGLFLQFFGLSMESIADAQKAAFKARRGNRNKWCNVGFWKYFTHPNFLGEIMFWLGTFMGGVGAYAKITDWIIACLGLFGVVVIMIKGTEQLDVKEKSVYEYSDEFKHFRDKHSFLGPRNFV